MKKYFVGVIGLLFVFGCAAPNSERYQQTVHREVSRLAVPTQSFSSFSRFLLNPMILDDMTRSKPEKTQVASQLESKIEGRVSPLLQEWTQNPKVSDRTLTITPELYELHVVSSGARFWVGAMAGDSRIDMVLTIVDAESHDVIAKPRIILTASAMGGGWSVGSTDRNLLNYVADITYEYLKNHY